MKKIITVCGAIGPSECSMVLSHEHIFIDLQNQAAKGASEDKITPADRAGLMCDPYSMKDNLLLSDFEDALSEGKMLLENNCNTVVDCSLREIGRDPVLLKRFAQASSLNVVMGCGWYTGDTHPADFAASRVEKLAEDLLFEIQNGVDNTNIKPGIIGEIGTSKEITHQEWKALTAAGIAQTKSNLAIQIHIYPWANNGLAVTDRLFELGVAPERIVICHSDVSPDVGYIEALLEKGVYVEFDNFGKEFTPESGGFAGGDFIADIERSRLAAEIIKKGYGSQLLLTNDICLKCMLKSCGGEGYSHIFRNIVPMLEAEGIEKEYLEKVILHENPLRMLAV